MAGHRERQRFGVTAALTTLTAVVTALAGIGIVVGAGNDAQTVVVSGASSPMPAVPAAAPPPPTTIAPAPPLTTTTTTTVVSTAPTTTTVAPPAGNPSAFVFEETNRDGTPVRWNPCQPIHYVVNLSEAPATAAGDIAGALARLSEATGLTFVSDGSTFEVPRKDRPSEVPALYGQRWAPLLIGWALPGESDELPGGRVVGEGGATSIGPAGGDQAFVTGEIVIDAHTTAGLAPGFGAGPTMGQLLLHELGHVIGLGHSTDPTQVMYPTLLPLPSAAFGAGDLAGLARLGHAAGCETTLPA